MYLVNAGDVYGRVSTCLNGEGYDVLGVLPV